MALRGREIVVGYDHGWPVVVGTFAEVAAFWGVKEASARFMSTPAWAARRKRHGRECKWVERTGVVE